MSRVNFVNEVAKRIHEMFGSDTDDALVLFCAYVCLLGNQIFNMVHIMETPDFCPDRTLVISDESYALLIKEFPNARYVNQNLQYSSESLRGSMPHAVLFSFVPYSEYTNNHTMTDQFELLNVE